MLIVPLAFAAAGIKADHNTAIRIIESFDESVKA
jgi:hypothetical protein